MKVNIYNDFLNEKDFNKIKDVMMGSNFPWYYNSYKVYSNTHEDYIKNFQFTHTFFSENAIKSEFMYLLDPIIKKNNIKSLIKVKANLVTFSENIIEYEKHIDTDVHIINKTGIYYLNDNNGYTVVDDKKILSKQNCFVEFDSNIQHFGTNCTDEKIRILINFNYF
jgi:hypothetical protein